MNNEPVATVLAVDDEVENLEVLRRALATRSDLRVLTVFSAGEALAVLRSSPVDLILVDQRMPGMTGSDLLARLEQGGNAVPAIIVTAYPEDEAVIEACRRGSPRFVVSKPWRVDELMLAVEFALKDRIGAMAHRDTYDADE